MTDLHQPPRTGPSWGPMTPGIAPPGYAGYPGHAGYPGYTGYTGYSGHAGYSQPLTQMQPSAYSPPTAYAPSGYPPPSAYPPPTFGPPQPPQPPQPPPRRHTGRIVAVVAALVIGLPVLLLGATIAIGSMAGRSPSAAPSSSAPAVPAPSPGPTRVNVRDLAIGDCFNSPPIPADGSTVGVAGVDRVPCSSPHVRQVIDTKVYGNTTWAATQKQATDQCLDALQTKLPAAVRDDRAYRPALVHSEPAAGRGTVRASCVVTTAAPRTGSVLP